MPAATTRTRISSARGSSSSTGSMTNGAAGSCVRAAWICIATARSHPRGGPSTLAPGGVGEMDNTRGRAADAPARGARRWGARGRLPRSRAQAHGERRGMSKVEYTLEELLAHYQGVHVRGSEGDVAFRKTLRTDVLTLTDQSLRNETLSPDEADDLLAYFGWNLWDVLGTRVTEGESGLIPRQEYEAISMV